MRHLKTNYIDCDQPILEVIDGSFVRSGKTIIHRLNLKLLPKQILAIIGPNGAGKSTLAGILSTDTPLTTGSLNLFNQPSVLHQRVNLAQRLALLPQSSPLCFPFTVEEVVHMGRLPHHKAPEANAKIVSLLLKRLDLWGIKDRPYTTLSGGEKQRTQIARVMGQVWHNTRPNQTLLILDEPTQALDLGHQQALFSLLEEAVSFGTAIILITHDLNQALKYSDQTLLLEKGKTTAIGSPTEVITTHQIERSFGAKVQLIPIADESKSTLRDQRANYQLHLL